MSPYPTVVNVATAHHKDSPMFLKASGCALFSTIYIILAENSRTIKVINKVDISSVFILERAFPKVLTDSEYLNNLKILINLNNLNTLRNVRFVLTNIGR